IAPTITMPPIMIALGSPFAELTNWARPMVPPAPPLLSNCTEETSFALCIAVARLRPVWSQPPPGLAGIIIFKLGCALAIAARADSANAAIKLKTRMCIVPPWTGSVPEPHVHGCIVDDGKIDKLQI